MASISYTALRELESTGYTKGGSDISAAAGDDSFNSAVTDLLGLNNDEWLNVTGFANAANNGWFQANGASTSTKITQDTTTSLVTEAAGLSITLNGYKRGLGQSYSMDFGLERADRQTKSKRALHQPMGGGQPETIFYHSETMISCMTGVIAETNIKQWREFLASVQSGEVFTFDRYGTAASPVEQRNAIIVSDEYTEDREGSIYPGNYRISFTVRLLS